MIKENLKCEVYLAVTCLLTMIKSIFKILWYKELKRGRGNGNEGKRGGKKEGWRKRDLVKERGRAKSRDRETDI